MWSPPFLRDTKSARMSRRRNGWMFHVCSCGKRWLVGHNVIARPKAEAIFSFLEIASSASFAGFLAMTEGALLSLAMTDRLKIISERFYRVVCFRAIIVARFFYRGAD